MIAGHVINENDYIPPRYIYIGDSVFFLTLPRKIYLRACVHHSEKYGWLARLVLCTLPMQKESQSDFHFVERPSQDLFCPVSFELLLEPQLTSCCGHHLSLEVATRLRKEGKPCPLCNGEQWQYMLDKNCRRKVHQVSVLCWHSGNGCGWVGGICELEKHAHSCEKRPWTCKYCQVEFPYGEGGEKHWPTCPKFPEPCPNSCGVGSVERCNMEQHRSKCSLEPVACEMKEFGCSVVVPRKELARHMRESELQHLTAMTMLNLRLTKQLQWEALEREKKIIQLQQEITEQKKLQIEMQAEMKSMLENREKEENEQHEQQVTELQGPERFMSGRDCGCVVLTFSGFSKWIDVQNSTCSVISEPFYSHHSGYKFRLIMIVYGPKDRYIEPQILLVKGEYDDQLYWPVVINGCLEILNQAGDHDHLDAKFCDALIFTQDLANTPIKALKERRINLNGLVDSKYHGVLAQYVINDCVKFRIKMYHCIIFS